MLTLNLYIAYSFKLYVETEKLIDLEFAFAKKVGIPVSEDTKYNLVSFIDLKGKFDNVPKLSAMNKFMNNPLGLKMPDSN